MSFEGRLLVSCFHDRTVACIYAPHHNCSIPPPRHYFLIGTVMYTIIIALSVVLACERSDDSLVFGYNSHRRSDKNSRKSSPCVVDESLALSCAHYVGGS